MTIVPTALLFGSLAIVLIFVLQLKRTAWWERASTRPATDPDELQRWLLIALTIVALLSVIALLLVLSSPAPG